MNKCPECGLESLDNKKCSKCGFDFTNETEITETKIEEIEEIVEKTENQVHNLAQNTEKNDDIQWSDLKDIPLGEVIDYLQELSDHEDEQMETESKEISNEIYEDSPILAAYLKAHKEGRQLEFQDEIKGILQQKSNINKSIDLEETSEKNSIDDSESSSTSLETDSEKDRLNNEVNVVDEEKEEKQLNSEESEEQEDTELLENLENDKALSKEIENFNEASIIENSVSDLAEQTDMTSELIVAHELPITSEEQVESEEQIISSENKTEEISTQTKKSSKRKWVYSVIALSMVGLSGSAYYYVHAQQVAQEIKENQEKKLKQTNQQILELFTSSDEQFLKQSTTLASIENFENKLQEFKDVAGYAKSEKLLAHAKDTLSKLNLLNEKFTGPVIVGDQLEKDVHVKDITNVEFQSLTGTNAFVTLYNQAVTKGQEEVAQARTILSESNDVINKLQNDTLDASVTQETYDATVSHINQLHDDSLKIEYLKKLEPVKAALDKKAADEKAAKEQAEQQAKAQAEQVAKQQAEQMARQQAELLAKQQAEQAARAVAQAQQNEVQN